MANCFPPPFGTTIIGTDQLDLLLHMTFAVRSFSILSFTHWYFFIAIGHGFWDTDAMYGSASAILLRFV